MSDVTPLLLVQGGGEHGGRGLDRGRGRAGGDAIAAAAPPARARWPPALLHREEALLVHQSPGDLTNSLDTHIPSNELWPRFPLVRIQKVVFDPRLVLARSLLK